MNNSQSKLLDILTHRRGHDSKGEKVFIKKYLHKCKPLTSKTGEVIAYIYDNHNPKHPNNILWSSHIDTMHRTEPDKVTQEVFVDTFDTAFVDEKSDCLGADDGAGVWLMLEMIEADVEGTYIFHRGEERGCWGSKQVATDHEEYLKTFTHAIAFDRRGNTSIITHQSSSRCCSDILGQSLIDLFSMGFVLDDTGVFTDTAEYVHLIPECLNISIGYQSEHTSKETLDLNFALELRNRIVSIQWDKIALPVERKPEARPSYSYYGGLYGGYYGDNSYDEIMYMSHKQLNKWVDKASSKEIAYVLEDLISQVQYLEDIVNENGAYAYPYADNDEALDKPPYQY